MRIKYYSGMIVKNWTLIRVIARRKGHVIWLCLCLNCETES